LCGQPPFTGGTSVQKMQRHRTEFAERIPELNPTVSSDFALIVEKLMEKNPARRYRSAAEVREALLPWSKGDPEKPLDVDPTTSEAEAIQELDKEQSAEPGLWWEEVPVITFEATAKHSTNVDSAAVPARKGEKEAGPAAVRSKNHPLIAVAIVAGLIGLVLLLELIRR
jgi:eukaryotic-like serine/threonine-protein kinase